MLLELVTAVAVVPAFGPLRTLNLTVLPAPAGVPPFLRQSLVALRKVLPLSSVSFALKVLLVPIALDEDLGVSVSLHGP